MSQNGAEASKKPQIIEPDVKAIISSGYSETEDVKIAQKFGTEKYIKRPYTLEKGWACR